MLGLDISSSSLKLVELGQDRSGNLVLELKDVGFAYDGGPTIVRGLTTEVYRGDKIGLIRFGSRTDVYVPAAQAKALVQIGDRVVGGMTALARFNS